MFLEIKKSALLVGLQRTYKDDIEREEKKATLKTADKLAKGFDFTLASN